MTLLPKLAPYSEQIPSPKIQKPIPVPAKSPSPQREPKQPYQSLSLNQDYTKLLTQYRDLELKYKHLQSLLKDSQELAASQQKEIQVLKHAFKQQQQEGISTMVDEDFSSILAYQEDQIAKLRSQNTELLVQLAAFYQKSDIPNPTPLERIDFKEKERKERELIDLSFEYHSPILSDTNNQTASVHSDRKSERLDTQSNTSTPRKKVPEPFELKDQKVNTVVERIFKSASKELIVESVIDDSILDVNQMDLKRSSTPPQWLPGDQSVSSRSPSPTKSMLITERDGLEQELLAQYERMRKLEDMEKLLLNIK